MTENPFKARSYTNVARQIEQLDEDIESVVEGKRLREIKGVGDALEGGPARRDVDGLLRASRLRPAATGFRGRRRGSGHTRRHAGPAVHRAAHHAKGPQRMPGLGPTPRARLRSQNVQRQRCSSEEIDGAHRTRP